MARRSARGYTLIELVIVVAVIGVLSSLGVPKLQNAFKRAKAVEAHQTLATLERTMKEHYNRTGQYPLVSGAQNPVEPIGTRSHFDLTQPGWKDISFKSEAGYLYRYSFTTSRDSSGRVTHLSLYATGDTDFDGIPLVIQREYVDGTLTSEFMNDD